jgi:hypothetical protein
LPRALRRRLVLALCGVIVLDSPTGDDFAVDAVLPLKATIDETVFDFYSGPTDCFDVVNTLRVKLYSGEPSSAPKATILSGRSIALPLKNPSGDWEIIQFCNAELVDTNTYDDQTALWPPRHRACHGRAVAGRPTGPATACTSGISRLPMCLAPT